LRSETDAITLSQSSSSDPGRPVIGFLEDNAGVFKSTLHGRDCCRDKFTVSLEPGDGCGSDMRPSGEFGAAPPKGSAGHSTLM